MLNHGVWHGRRIVSAAWIKEMTTQHSSLPGYETGFGDAYGYLWWLGHEKIGDRNVPWIAGFGLGGQCVFVVPNEDLIVVATAGAYRTDSYAAGKMALAMAVRAALPH